MMLGLRLCAVVAQLVEHVIGNDEVSGSIPDNGSEFSFPKKIRVPIIILSAAQNNFGTSRYLEERFIE